MDSADPNLAETPVPPSKVDETEQRNAFRDEAEQRHAQIIASGETIPWSEIRDYLTERAAGKAPPRPQPRKLGR